MADVYRCDGDRLPDDQSQLSDGYFNSRVVHDLHGADVPQDLPDIESRRLPDLCGHRPRRLWLWQQQVPGWVRDDLQLCLIDVV